MPKGQKKNIDKEQGKTKYEAPRSVNYRATQNKNYIETTALERSVVYTTGGFIGLSLHDTLDFMLILHNTGIPSLIPLVLFSYSPILAKKQTNLSAFQKSMYINLRTLIYVLT